MLSWAGQASLSEQMSRRVRAVFGAMNFWAIIMYNLVSLNSLEFTELVARRLLLTGEGQRRGEPQHARRPSRGHGPPEMPHSPSSPGTPQGGPEEWERRGNRGVTKWGAAPRHR